MAPIDDSMPRIAGEGEHEAAWRASSWLGRLPEQSPAQLLYGSRRLVLLSPHPDDETLACAGLLHAAGQAGLAVHLLAVTDGEACYPGDAHWTPSRLREQRPREVERALDELGVQARVQRLGLGDGAVTASAAELEAALRALLQPGDLLVAPWEQDGHPDHDASGRAALAAAGGADIRLLRYPVWAWHWLAPDAAQPPFQAVRMPLPPEAVARKQRAIACFESQLGTSLPPAPAPVLPPHVVERFHRPYEVYLP